MRVYICSFYSLTVNESKLPAAEMLIHCCYCAYKHSVLAGLTITLFIILNVELTQPFK